MVAKIRIISLNVRGIGDAQKRDKLFAWFKQQQADVILMQEVHCTKKTVGKLRRAWNGKSFFSLTNSAHSRGVAILLRKDLSAVVLNHSSDNHGRQLILNVELNNQTISLVNIYAPNIEKERILFFSQLSQWITTESKSVNDSICGGDFNCCLSD